MEAVTLILLLLTTFLSVVNTIILVALTMSLIKFFGPKKSKPKAVNNGLQDLPMKYEKQSDYGDFVRSQQVSPDLWLIKDE